MNVDIDELAKMFAKNEWTWSLKGRGHVIPDADDIEAALDTAARIMYDEPYQSNVQMNVGRLIVAKKLQGHEVYVYCGDYE